MFHEPDMGTSTISPLRHFDVLESYFGAGVELCKKLSFQSLVRGSSIKKFDLLGYKSGDVWISIQFSREYHHLKEYLKLFGILLSANHRFFSLSKELKLATALFSILADNNEIPDNYFELMRNIFFEFNVATLNNSQLLQELENEVECPITLEPLLNGVVLIPCAHKIQQTAAATLFGSRRSSWMVEPDKKCPVCVQPVAGYLDDRLTVELAEIILDSQESLPGAIVELREKIPKKCKRVEKTQLEPLSYPGKTATFKKGLPIYGYLSAGELFFYNTASDSLIKEVYVQRNDKERVFISIKFLKNSKNFRKYLKTFGIYLEKCDLSIGLYRTRTEQHKLALYKIITENNEFSEIDRKSIQNIILNRQNL